jgi:hypothetical protein
VLGGEVETLLSNLILQLEREVTPHPALEGRLRDRHHHPVADPSERWDVYQIKKFAQHLDASQKAQVVKSFGGALSGCSARMCR